jgi:acetylornithine deacetylase/succinyl-diaminopimelate desuccinylase-like protein
MDDQVLSARVSQLWDATIIPGLMEFIRIPNKSPVFDPQWEEHGDAERAVSLVESWCRSQPLAGMTVEVLRLSGRTPLICVEVPGASDECVLLYGHLDKQPEMTGWRAGLGPWTPVLDGDRLYGRGGADDGYAVFASLTALRVLQELGIPHARSVVLVEACEESGSYDLPYYVEQLSERIGAVSLVICLDSGCGSYDQLWNTTSLRGLIAGNLYVEVLKEGVHSGEGSGIIPSCFRLIRSLISRLEDEQTGRIIPPEFSVGIPPHRLEQAARTAKALGKEIWAKFPFLEAVRPVSEDITELILNQTWRPALSVTGAAGLPDFKDAGNVTLAMNAVRLSLRLPPTCHAGRAADHLRGLILRDPPYGARIRFEIDQAVQGWDAAAFSPWLEESVNRASRTFFGAEAMSMGEGGSIPFMAMLGERYSEAQFLITGVLGPSSNAHGPNEFLHVPTGKKLTSCIARVIADHYRARRE